MTFSGDPPNVVRIGQGGIAARLTAHRADQAILAYRQRGKLMVTWAALLASQMDGVERFLANRYTPLIGDRHPDVLPIEVNLLA